MKKMIGYLAVILTAASLSCTGMSRVVFAREAADKYNITISLEEEDTGAPVSGNSAAVAEEEDRTGEDISAEAENSEKAVSADRIETSAADDTVKEDGDVADKGISGNNTEDTEAEVINEKKALSEADNDKIYYGEGIEKNIGDIELADSRELFEGYMDETMYPDKQTALEKSYRKDRLGTVEKRIYNILAKHIKSIAKGNKSSSYIRIYAGDYLGKSSLTFTDSELGISDPSDAAAALSSKLQSADMYSVMGALLMDFPYELYWFDKTTGYKYEFSNYYFITDTTGSKNKYTLVEEPWLDIVFYVEASYSSSGWSGSTETDTSKTGAASKAVAKAKRIVAAADSKSDYNKLVYYRNKICSLTSYNYSAIYNSDLYGDPWQMIYVFDGDPSTNVVCEGYAKAFKYLCDLTSFSNSRIECNIVNGYLDGGAHMWNIVTMNDGKRYLADITNCDVTGGSYTSYFLRGKKRGSYSSGYVIAPKGSSGTNTYVYDDYTMKMYTKSELTLSSSAYGVVSVKSVKLNKASAGVYSGKIITLKASVAPSNASDKSVIWKSSNTKIATVTSGGVVTGKKAGKATITVTTKDGSKKAACRVTVKKAVPVTGVKLNKSKAAVQKGESITLKATISPAGATNKNVTWSSSDKSVAVVTSKGVVTGVKKGTAVITVTTKDGKKKAECLITVK